MTVVTVEGVHIFVQIFGDSKKCRTFATNKTNKTNIFGYATFIHCPLPSLRMSPFFFQMQMM